MSLFSGIFSSMPIYKTSTAIKYNQINSGGDGYLVIDPKGSK